MPTHPQLMAMIEQYSFDNPDLPKPDFGFLDRLCLETGWQKSFAAGALREYRRFVYLAVTGDRPVTPSREVDAVWHLHLTYTRSYWQRLHAILPRELHHEPTPGGSVAAATYRTQYADTKARYVAEFGEAVPEAYWPPEDERFQPDMRVMRGRASDGLAVAGAAVAATVFAAPAFAADAFTPTAVTAIVIGVGLTVLLGSLVFLSRIGSSAAPNKKKKDHGSDSGVYMGGCDGGSVGGGKGGKGDNGGEGGEGQGGEGGGEGGGDGGGCGGGCGS